MSTPQQPDPSLSEPMSFDEWYQRTCIISAPPMRSIRKEAWDARDPEIKALGDELEKEKANVKTLIEDWADDDKRIREIAKPLGIDVDGDTTYVPQIVDLTESIAEQLKALKAELAEAKAQVKALSCVANQATACGKCGVYKHTPWRHDEFNYICATCLTDIHEAELTAERDLRLKAEADNTWLKESLKKSVSWMKNKEGWLSPDLVKDVEKALAGIMVYLHDNDELGEEYLTPGAKYHYELARGVIAKLRAARGEN